MHHLVESTSDHCILLISNENSPSKPHKCRFHFEAMWTKREDCCEVIEAAWYNIEITNTPEGIALGLQHCATELSRWNRTVVENIPKKIQEKRQRLNSLTIHDSDRTNGVEINMLRKEINDLLDSEETMWHQCYKVHWFSEGDRNTKFFHARASDRHKKNTILGLWNNEGKWCEDKDSIVATAVSYF